MQYDIKIDTNSIESSIHNLINIIDNDLLNAPKGVIRLESSRGYSRYYYYKNKSDKKGQYLSANNIEFIASICQRDYNIKLAKRMRELLNKYRKGIPFDLYVEVDDIYNSFRAGKQSLIEPIIPEINTYIADWYEANPGFKNSYSIEKGIATKRGELVRSKSEKIIADRLFDFNVPYVYEPEIILNDSIKYPDFLVLNKRTRKTLLWEHFGLTDDMNYSVNNLLKLLMYEENGYLLGSSLIATFESREYILDTNLVDVKIEAFLL